jgi:alanine dehydrogenase
MSIPVITDKQIREGLSFEVVLSAVERAFVALDAGKSTLFEVVRGTGGGDHFFGVKSAREGSIPVLGLKAGSYVPDNHAHGLPSHLSTTLLIDDRTGVPMAVVEANYLNGLRTSAANALAVRSLARQDSTVVGIIGIGAQAVFEVLAVAHVRPIRRIFAASRSSERREEFMAGIRERSDIEVTFTDAETAARSADVLVTVTPSRVPVVLAGWVRPGTHVSAMGADNVGKQELDIELVRRSRLWVDHPEQAVIIGETQHAYRAGFVSVEALRTQTLGRLLREPIDRNSTDITIFDSSGIAIQDLAAAYAAFQLLRP